ncbi:hypothetical protein E7T06_15925 [Deinococcus sp. Arct2-2]|uniref:hypothetical protein n=1 Tax=Deinococcus sp. Arct2-2 TaxID=2568653 RepID=UPI0010A53870|nr:hypothetical protein [Deinococcus sp. Arct2-2]THF68585.1 hypothetical protein E7T06_15925 [Deinococcus sp. Arct2-2]
MSRTKQRLLLLSALLLSAPASAATVKLRPQGAELTRLVQEALAAISTKDLPVTLDSSSGPILSVGSSNGVAFNPDVSARVLGSGTDQRIEFNPNGPQPLTQTLRAELTRFIGLKAWTPEAAKLRLSGADLNGDGAIDLTDFALIMNNFGKTGSLPGDLNADSRVDDLDLRLFGGQYKP